MVMELFEINLNYFTKMPFVLVIILGLPSYVLVKMKFYVNQSDYLGGYSFFVFHNHLNIIWGSVKNEKCLQNGFNWICFGDDF